MWKWRAYPFTCGPVAGCAQYIRGWEIGGYRKTWLPSFLDACHLVRPSSFSFLDPSFLSRLEAYRASCLSPCSLTDRTELNPIAFWAVSWILLRQVDRSLDEVVGGPKK